MKLEMKSLKPRETKLPRELKVTGIDRLIKAEQVNYNESHFSCGAQGNMKKNVIDGFFLEDNRKWISRQLNTNPARSDS